MPSPVETTEVLAIDLARECLYSFLAAAIREPHRQGWSLVLSPQSQSVARAAAELLREEANAHPVASGFGELPPERLTLDGVLAELRRPLEELCAEYDRVFGLVPTRESPPYETEYFRNSEPFFRTQQLADVAGFYRAFGLCPSQVEPERPDHLALELEFMAFLLMKKRLAAAQQDPAAPDRAAVCDDAQRNFFRDHLAWWVPAFATGLRCVAGEGLYAALGEVLSALVAAERGWLGVDVRPSPLQPDFIERPEEQSGCAGCVLQQL